MQTFITSSDFTQVAQSLDNRRLNKQLLECRQILSANAGASRGWVNHPATKMWKDNPLHLHQYAKSIAVEMAGRGISWEKNASAIESYVSTMDLSATARPWWMTDLVVIDKVATSHRANLYFKDPVHYAEFKIDADIFDANRDYFTCCERCNYYWPTHTCRGLSLRVERRHLPGPRSRRVLLNG